MKIDILSLFPNMFNGVFTESIIKRAVDDKKVEINLIILEIIQKILIKRSMILHMVVVLVWFYAANLSLIVLEV